MKVLIADDQIEVRSALRALLEDKIGIGGIDEVGEADGLLLKAENNRPDLLLLDWELQKRTMADIVRTLRRLAPALRIIAMSSFPEAAGSAAEAGVDAFVSKGENSDRLIDTINTVIRNRNRSSGQVNN